MDSIEKLKNIFRDFPTVGPRTAGRFVYHLMKLPKDKIDEFISAIEELKNKIKLCKLCFNPYEGESDVCPICQNPQRNKNLLCVVEKETDLLSIEGTKKFNGLYFILGGTKHLRIEQLKKRISTAPAGGFSEIIIALNPTPEGRATSFSIERELKEAIPSPAFKVTHLAKGIPVGGELEYADEETLENALEGRK